MKENRSYFRKIMALILIFALLLPMFPIKVEAKQGQGLNRGAKSDSSNDNSIDLGEKKVCILNFSRPSSDYIYMSDQSQRKFDVSNDLRLNGNPVTLNGLLNSDYQDLIKFEVDIVGSENNPNINNLASVDENGKVTIDLSNSSGDVNDQINVKAIYLGDENTTSCQDEYTITIRAKSKRESDNFLFLKHQDKFDRSAPEAKIGENGWFLEEVDLVAKNMDDKIEDSYIKSDRKLFLDQVNSNFPITLYTYDGQGPSGPRYRSQIYDEKIQIDLTDPAPVLNKKTFRTSESGEEFNQVMEVSVDPSFSGFNELFYQYSEGEIDENKWKKIDDEELNKETKNTVEIPREELADFDGSINLYIKQTDKAGRFGLVEAKNLYYSNSKPVIEGKLYKDDLEANIGKTIYVKDEELKAKLSATDKAGLKSIAYSLTYTDENGVNKSFESTIQVGGEEPKSKNFEIPISDENGGTLSGKYKISLIVKVENIYGLTNETSIDFNIDQKKETILNYSKTDDELIYPYESETVEFVVPNDLTINGKSFLDEGKIRSEFKDKVKFTLEVTASEDNYEKDQLAVLDEEGRVHLDISCASYDVDDKIRLTTEYLGSDEFSPAKVEYTIIIKAKDLQTGEDYSILRHSEPFNRNSPNAVKNKNGWYKEAVDLVPKNNKEKISFSRFSKEDRITFNSEIRERDLFSFYYYFCRTNRDLKRVKKHIGLNIDLNDPKPVIEQLDQKVNSQGLEFNKKFRVKLDYSFSGYDKLYYQYAEGDYEKDKWVEMPESEWKGILYDKYADIPVDQLENYNGKIKLFIKQIDKAGRQGIIASEPYEYRSQKPEISLNLFNKGVKEENPEKLYNGQDKLSLRASVKDFDGFNSISYTFTYIDLDNQKQSYVKEHTLGNKKDPDTGKIVYSKLEDFDIGLVDKEGKDLEGKYDIKIEVRAENIYQNQVVKTLEFAYHNLAPEVKISYVDEGLGSVNTRDFAGGEKIEYLKNSRKAIVEIIDPELNSSTKVSEILKRFDIKAFEKASDENLVEIYPEKNSIRNTKSGNPIAFVKWMGEENDINKITVVVYFEEEYRYYLDFNYEDSAGNITKYEKPEIKNFIIDRTSPSLEVKLNDSLLKKFDKILYYRLFTNKDFTLNLSYDDNLADIEKVDYIKVLKDGKSYNEILAKLNDPSTDLASIEFNDHPWIKVDTNTIRETDEDAYCYVFRVMDRSKNVKLISSGGIILDRTKPIIADIKYFIDGKEMSKDEISSQVLNSDVEIQIKIADLAGGIISEKASGIRKYSYELINSNGQIMDQGSVDFSNRPDNHNINKYKNPIVLGDLKSEIELKKILIENEDQVLSLKINIEDMAGNRNEDDPLILSISKTPPSMDTRILDTSGKELKPSNIISDVGYYKDNLQLDFDLFNNSYVYDKASAKKMFTLKKDGIIIDLPFDLLEGKEKKNHKGNNDYHTSSLNFDLEGSYEISVDYTDKAKNTLKSSFENQSERITADSNGILYKFVLDKTAPQGEIQVDNLSGDATKVYSSFQGDNAFNQYSNKGYTIKISGKDLGPASDKGAEIYYTVESAPRKLTFLKETTGWKEYRGPINLEKEGNYFVYAKLVDKSGNETYLSTKGFIVDKTAPEIDLKYLTKAVKNKDYLFNKDVRFRVSAEDINQYKSGIAKLTYRIRHEGGYDKTYSLVDMSDESRILDEIISDSNIAKDFKLDSKTYNGDGIVLELTATDRAGNKFTRKTKFNIDIIAPKIAISYDQNTYYSKYGDRTYFNKDRVATITYTERESNFNRAEAINGIKLKGYNKDLDLGKVKYEWLESKGTGDAREHYLKIYFDQDSNYIFDLSYTDEAQNPVSRINYRKLSLPHKFTIDKKAPRGSVSESVFSNSWSSLLKEINFRLWSRDIYSIDFAYDKKDTSGVDIANISYYRSNAKKALTYAELKSIPMSNWIRYDFKDKPRVGSDETSVIYIRFADRSGNVSFVSTDGLISDTRGPKIKLNILTKAANHNIFNSDVDVRAIVEDQLINNSYSGLKRVYYEIFSDGKLTKEDTIYEFGKTTKDLVAYKDLKKHIARDIRISSGANDSNRVVLKVTAEDNAGNKSIEEIRMAIDITAPKIRIRYDNNDGVTVGKNTYFNKTRRATIEITEVNFNPKDVVYKISNKQGPMPAKTSWTTRGSGKEIVHTQTITYSEDGEYKFDIAYTDLANNKAKEVDTRGQLGPKDFVIDKTKPLISVSYDKTNRENKYKENRIATISVTEKNFDPAKLVLNVKASLKGKTITSPKLSNWTRNGDKHTASLIFENDGDYSFTLELTDRSRNKSDLYKSDAFTIDKTKPLVRVIGMLPDSASDEDQVGFAIEAIDNNLKIFNVYIRVNEMLDGRIVERRVDLGEFKNIENGKRFIVENLKNDGLYNIKIQVEDESGNKFDKLIYSKGDRKFEKKIENLESILSFSVNRKGSSFNLNEYTKKVNDKYFIKELEDNLVIEEINVDKLKSYQVKIEREGSEPQVLEEGRDYKLIKSENDNSWKVYRFVIFKENFKEEGNYRVTVASTDRLGNKAFSDVRQAEIEFVLDKSAPTVTVTGITEDGIYQKQEQNVTIMPRDDGGYLKSVKVEILDENGNISSRPIDLKGKELHKVLEKNDGKLNFKIEEGLYQQVRIIIEDESGNIITTDGYGNVYEELVKNITVTPNSLLVLWANRPIRYSFISLLLAILAYIIYKSYKKHKERAEG